MNLTIEIPDDNAARYRKVAQAHGLTVDRWLLELADTAAAVPGELLVTPGEQTMSEVMREIWGDLPEDARARLPGDGASQHDHYIYGLPKRKDLA